MTIDWSGITVKMYVEPPPLRGDEWRPFEPCLENLLAALEYDLVQSAMRALGWREK